MCLPTLSTDGAAYEEWVRQRELRGVPHCISLPPLPCGGSNAMAGATAAGGASAGGKTACADSTAGETAGTGAGAGSVLDLLDSDDEAVEVAGAGQLGNGFTLLSDDSEDGSGV